MITQKIVEMYMLQLKSNRSISVKISSLDSLNSNLTDKIKENFNKVLTNAKEEGLDILSISLSKSVDPLAQKSNMENVEPNKIKFAKKLNSDSKFQILKKKK